jgi:hypothetical protein
LSDTNKLGTPVGWNHNRPDHRYSLPSTIDVEEIKGWEKYGDNLLGYGINPREKRALILDVDVGGDKEGAKSLNTLVFDFGLKKADFIVQSKSGGLHLYYKYPDNATIVGLPIDNIPHIDIRTSNNFVVGPGSLGGKYRIKSGTIETPLVELPADLVKIMPRKKGITVELTESNIENTKSFSGNDPLKPVVSDFGVGEANPLKGEIPDLIVKGERDNVLVRLIGSWVKAGHSRNNIIALLESAIDKCEDKDELDINEYIAKVETTMQKSSFSSIQPEPLQFFIDNAIYIDSLDGVYQIPDRRYYIKGLDSLYAPHFYFVEKETATGTKKQEVSAFKAWKKSSKRKNVENIGYKPITDHVFFDKAQNARVCNLYSPVVHVDMTSEVQRARLKYPDIRKRFLRLCEYLFGDKTELMIEWAAHQVQHPDIKLGFAPVMISETRGVGKNLFFDIMASLVGRHNTAVYSSDTIMDGHNDHVLKNHLVLINESYVPITDRYAVKAQASMVERIKMLITDSAQTVNPKFIAPFNTTSYTNYIFASNNLAAVPMEIGDRRFEIIIINATKTLGPEFYGPLWEITGDDETAMLLASEIYNFLKEVKIYSINAGFTPADDVYKEMVRHAGRSEIEARVYEDMDENRAIFAGDLITFPLFLWYILNHIDPNVTQTVAKNVLRSVAKSLTTPSLKGKPRRASMMVPDYTIKGQYVPEGKKREAVYAIRNYKHWYNAEMDEIKDEYYKNFYFTKGVDSKDVVSRSDRKRGKKVKLLPFKSAADR